MMQLYIVWMIMIQVQFVSLSGCARLDGMQVTGDMLDDGKYQCNMKDELAQKLAQNLRIDLSPYLLYV